VMEIGLLRYYSCPCVHPSPDFSEKLEQNAISVPRVAGGAVQPQRLPLQNLTCQTTLGTQAKIVAFAWDQAFAIQSISGVQP
jgi:hypothetical protein